MALSRRGVERMLGSKLGMVREERDQRVYRLFVDGKLVVQTKVSRGSSHHTLGHDLVTAMARDLKIDVNLFRELEACTKDLHNYLGALKEHGYL
jgi:hypothetical protein